MSTQTWIIASIAAGAIAVTGLTVWLLLRNKEEEELVQDPQTAFIDRFSESLEDCYEQNDSYLPYYKDAM